MIKTFDFIIYAQKDEKLKQNILEAMDNIMETEICTDIHKIMFKPKLKKVVIAPLSNNSSYRSKIPPTEVSFKAIICMLSGNWDDVTDDDYKIL